MTNCKYCNAIPREYRDQKDQAGQIFHIIECPKECHIVFSTSSITNARNLWKKQNIVTKQDMYDEIVNILGHYFNNETLEKARLTFKQYEAKI